MEITREDVIKRVKAMRGSRSPIVKRWDFYRNDVARVPYFPYLHKETSEHYKKRIKISVGWCGSLANRIAAYFRKPPINVRFTVDGKEDHKLAKEAADTWAEISEYNEWDSFMIDVARDSGVGGNGYTKERIAFFDHECGRNLKTGKFKGRMFVDRISEAFVYRMIFGGVAGYVVAWVRIGGKAKFLHQDTPDENKLEHIEVILPSRYDEMTGERTSPSNWSIWEREKRIYGPYEIPYSFIPVQRFANLVSRPESENGISDIEWSIPLNDYINHVLSGAVRSVEYHGEPKIVAQGVEDDSDIKWGTDNMITLPGVTAGGGVPQMKFLTWNQNIEGARTLYRDGADIISALSGIPKHMMHDLEGSGKVPSGVALRIIYESLNQVCTLKEAGFKAGEERVIAACLDQLAYHNNKPGYFSDVVVTVQYNPNRTPRDFEAEFNQDMKKMLVKYLNLIDLVLKYEPGIKTREQALEFLKMKAEEKKQLEELGLISKAPTFEWTENDESGSNKQVSTGDSDA